MNTMLKCRDIGKFLYDYVDGSLDPGTSQQLEQHLADCPGCLAFINTYRQTIKLSSELCPKDMPPELKQKLRSFIKAKALGHQPGFFQRLWLFLTRSS